VTALLAVLSVAVVVAVVVTFGAPAAPSSASIGADAGDAYESIEGVEATRTTVVEHGDDVHRTVASVQLRPGTDHRRVEVVEATDRLHEVVVENDSTVWLYDRDAAEVSRFSASGSVTGPTVGDRVERLFERLDVTRDDESATVGGVSPLPVVPQGAASPATAATDTAALRLSFEGTAQVDGREAYVLELAAPDDGSGAFQQTIWVDTQRFFPLQRQTSWTEDGQRMAVTTVYEDVTFDPGLDDDTFTFESPANASVETLETPERTAYASVEKLRSATNVSVPAPEVPESLRLAVATETTGEVHGVGLQYVNETATISVAKYDRPFPPRGDREVTVAGRDAAVSLGSTTSVSWNCGDYRYTVRGEGVGVDALLAVAESVGCE
jgi:outer membrane lipoprotein-sorting protein